MSLPNNSTYQANRDRVFTSNEGRAFVPQAPMPASPAPVQQPTRQSLLSKAVSGVKGLVTGKPSQQPAPTAPVQQSQERMSTELSKLGPVTTPYGGSTKYEKFHPAVDVAMPIGAKIPSLSDGTVMESVSGKKQGDRGYGNYILVRGNDGLLYKYSHNSKNYYPVGAKVTKGQPIAEAGNTGSTYSLSGGTGSHLDLRITRLFNGKMQSVDPNEL
jgi:murein DD-endopeptidase MepM/ murein hydrolase activator NlpD